MYTYIWTWSLLVCIYLNIRNKYKAMQINFRYQFNIGNKIHIFVHNIFRGAHPRTVGKYNLNAK